VLENAKISYFFWVESLKLDCRIFLRFFFLNVPAVLGSGGIELIFTSSWLGWPKQPIKWDVLYHVMPGSVFKWGAG